MLEPAQIIYLDNNATTALDPAVVEAMLPFLTSYYGNPSSGYRFGAQAREAIEHARAQVAALIGARPGEIVFTSCGTEASNTALASALALDPTRQGVVTTAVEHSATRQFCQQLQERGHPVTFLGVDHLGRIDLDALEAAITPATAIVSVMWANNETGVLFPVREIAEIARRKRVLFHSDAVQAAGKVPIAADELPANFLSLSAHKLHGPKGVGALYVQRGTAFRARQLGGSQEEGRRAGTENVAGIVGFGKAAELAREKLASEMPRVQALRDRFESGVLAAVPGAAVNGDPTARLPNTASLSFAGVDSAAALILLDQANLCCSAGSACRSGSPEPSHVLRAMGLSDERVRSSLRFSLSRLNHDEEIERALALVPGVIEKLRALQPRTPVA